MKAPSIDNYIFNLRDGKTTVSPESETVVDKVYENLRLIKPCGDDGRRELWLKAERGTIEDFGDYEEYLSVDMVSSYDEFREWWLYKYPEPIVWFHLVTVERDGYRAMFLGKKFVYQSPVPEWERLDYEIDVVPLFQWLLESVSNAIGEMKQGLYNINVDHNLSFKHRTGIIRRKDLWDIETDMRESYFSEISRNEIEEFVDLISEQKDNNPVGIYQEEMTSAKFYGYCKLGYAANNYAKTESLSAKELYYKYADGRDEGLSEIYENSPKEFDNWYHDRKRWGGHPWEVCRGGNSTHVDLYVCDSDNGYYLAVGGKSWSRSIEAIKFYIALRHAGVAVLLLDADDIKARLLEEDYIGIVPSGVTPAYCESYFPGYEITDFMNLPSEKQSEIVEKVLWLKEKDQRLY